MKYCNTIYNPSIGCEHQPPSDHDYKVMLDYQRWKHFNKNRRGDIKWGNKKRTMIGHCPM
jgi:hypothetical protein